MRLLVLQVGEPMLAAYSDKNNVYAFWRMICWVFAGQVIYRRASLLLDCILLILAMDLPSDSAHMHARRQACSAQYLQWCFYAEYMHVRPAQSA